MQSIEADYNIVTPMFIGGGDKADAPEIRPPSVKGALRFWWRALQWGACLNLCHQNASAALKELHRQEAELFGAAVKVKEETYGQGLCRIKLKNVQPKGIEQGWPKNNDGGAGFLGYGLDATQNGDPHRKAISQGSFTVCLMLKATISSEQVNQLKNTLLLWGLLGGLGSRSRRGFGSVAIKRLDAQDFDFKQSVDYYKCINDLLKPIDFAPAIPLFTALNEAMNIAQVGKHKDFKRLMDQLGAQYKLARQEAGKGRAKAPFGLPLAGNKGGEDESRRSSPLLMHIHSVNNEFVAMVTFIPAKFHYDYRDSDTILFYKALQNFMNKVTIDKVYP